MKNYEKYADEIKEYKGDNFCTEFIKPHILKKDSCCGVDCVRCCMLQMIWLLEDYEEPEEPETDWSKVEVDTPILVRNLEGEEWYKRHFAKYEGGTVYAWYGGRTSWSEPVMNNWNYAKLAEDQKEPEIDWNKVEVDTPILVKEYEESKWTKRYFAKYEDGVIYAWNNGVTSWTANDDECVIAWSFAKLAESEEE